MIMVRLGSFRLVISLSYTPILISIQFGLFPGYAYSTYKCTGKVSIACNFLPAKLLYYQDSGGIALVYSMPESG